jgi:SAM-dependent methyltransferase
MKKRQYLSCGAQKCAIQQAKKTHDAGMNFLKCQKCNVLRIPPKNLIYLNVMADRSDSNKIIINFLFRIRLWWLKKEVPKLHKKQTNILDVGCGDGQFISFLKENGYTRLTGLEPDILRARNAKKSGLPIFLSFKDMRNSTLAHKKADIIFLWHVLEHINQPIFFLNHLVKTLSKNGVLLVSVPNQQSMQTKLFGYYSSFPDYGRHIWYHDKNYLEYLITSFPLHKIQLVKDKNYEYEIFSWVDSMASYLIRNQNFIHKTIKKGDGGKFKKILALFFTISLLPLALILSFVSLRLKKGSTLTFIMRSR